MSEEDRWTLLTKDPITAELRVPIHPRYDSLRESENFYLRQIPYGVALPCNYRWQAEDYTGIIPGFRLGSSLVYWTYAMAQRIPNPVRPPLFYCWQYDLSELQQEGNIVEHRFPIYSAPITSKYIWTTSEGRLRVDLSQYESAVAGPEIFSPSPGTWNRIFAGMPQVRLNEDYRRVPVREAPPDDFPWPRQEYDWWQQFG